MMCFTKIRAMDFSQGNTQDFKDLWKQQRKWLGGNQFDIKTEKTCRDLFQCQETPSGVSSRRQNQYSIHLS